MNYRFIDLVDISAFREMLQSFYDATGILHGLVDDKNNVISAIGWENACTNFHRAFPISNERCLKSNRYLAEKASEGAVVGCKCENGLVDYAAPIIVDGRQLATLYFGQFLSEPPDLEFFRRQAKECGYDEEAYLETIRKLPVIPQARVESIMNFYGQLAQMLARCGLDRLRQREAERKLAKLNRELTRRVEERTAELEARNQELASEVAERRRTSDELNNNRTQLQAILDSSPVGIGWTRDGKVEYVNRKFTEMFGYELTDIPTVEDWYRQAYPDEIFREKVIAKWAQESSVANRDGVPPPLAAAVSCKDGSTRYVITSVAWSGDYRLVNFSDISERWQAEQREQLRNAILEMIAKDAPLAQTLDALVRSVEAEEGGLLCSILLIDETGRHLHLGAAPSLPDFYNQAIEGIEIGHGVGSCGAAAYLQQRVIVADIPQHPYWASFKDLAQQAGVASCWSEPILSSRGGLLGTFAIYHRAPTSPSDGDLRLIARAANLAAIAIERRQAKIELERQAKTDFLTGLANRRQFMEQAATDLARARRYGEPLSLLMIDLDHFKTVNDNHGHKTGDLVLKALACIMQKAVREVDLVSRIGGEEFAVVLPNTNCEQALQAAERLLRAVSEAPMQSEAGVPLHVTISVGVTTLTDVQEDVDQLLKQADEALYEAKRGGRNQVQVA